MSQPNRRAEDNCILKRLYTRYNVYIQIGTVLWMVAGGMLAIKAMASEAQAFGSRLTKLEQSQQQYNQTQQEIRHAIDKQGDQLKLIIEFFSIPNDRS